VGRAQAAGLLVGNFHLGKAAGCGCVDCRDNAINVAVESRAVADCHVLKLQSARPLKFCWYGTFLSVENSSAVQQRAVGWGVPSSFNRFDNGVTVEPAGDAPACAMVKEDEHRRALHAQGTASSLPRNSNRVDLFARDGEFLHHSPRLDIGTNPDLPCSVPLSIVAVVARAGENGYSLTVVPLKIRSLPVTARHGRSE